MSGGQKQRVAVARALAARPRLLLFDEPLSNLDAGLRDSTRVEIRNLLTRTGITSVFVTHDQSEAFSVADRIAVLNKGRVVQIGKPEHIYDRPVDAFSASFLGGCNLIAGRVASIDDLEVAIDALSIKVRAAHVSNDLAPAVGQNVTMAIRPHHMSVRLPNEPAMANSIEAAVEVMEDLGSITRLILRHSSGQRLMVTAPGHLRGRARDQLIIQWSPEHVWLLPEGSKP